MSGETDAFLRELIAHCDKADVVTLQGYEFRRDHDSALIAALARVALAVSRGAIGSFPELRDLDAVIKRASEGEGNG